MLDTRVILNYCAGRVDAHVVQNQSARGALLTPAHTLELKKNITFKLAIITVCVWLLWCEQFYTHKK